MKPSIITRVVLILLAAAAFTRCGSMSPSGTSGGTFTATSSGLGNFTAQAQTVSVSSVGAGLLSLIGTQLSGTNTTTIAINLGFVTGTGTYPLGVNFVTAAGGTAA